MPKLTFDHNPNGKLYSDMFPMILLRKVHLGQIFNFFTIKDSTDKNGIKLKTEPEHLFQAQVYMYFMAPLDTIPEHMFNYCFGQQKQKAIAALCERLKITPQAQVVMVTFTKDLAIDPTQPEICTITD